ncbi:MAG: acetylglutamate/acetylaminoadipate kinase [Haloferacaceae archaeon]|nr:acetylglutamate/acetylaminoadipate kinase [Haloferacaceae archaeon]
MSTLVVKIGGAEAVDATAVIADVAAHIADGRSMVLTHGGSTAVDATLERLGQTPEYVETPAGVTGRFTDAETMEVFTMVMPGQLNTAITVELQAVGVDAVGLSGVDGGLLRGPRKSAVRIVEDGRKRIRRGDHAGRIERVNVPLLRLLLEAGYTPVVSVPMTMCDSSRWTCGASVTSAMPTIPAGSVVSTDHVCTDRTSAPASSASSRSTATVSSNAAASIPASPPASVTPRTYSARPSPLRTRWRSWAASDSNRPARRWTSRVSRSLNSTAPPSDSPRSRAARRAARSADIPQLTERES